MVVPNSVLGTLRLSGHVFQLSSLAIIAPPPPVSACREEDGEADDDAKHDGRKTSGKMHDKECEENDKDMEGRST